MKSDTESETSSISIDHEDVILERKINEILNKKMYKVHRLEKEVGRLANNFSTVVDMYKSTIAYQTNTLRVLKRNGE